MDTDYSDQARAGFAEQSGLSRRSRSQLLICVYLCLSVVKNDRVGYLILSVLLTKATRVLSGDQDGTLIVPWPPKT